MRNLITIIILLACATCAAAASAYAKAELSVRQTQRLRALVEEHFFNEIWSGDMDCQRCDIVRLETAAIIEDDKRDGYQVRCRYAELNGRAAPVEHVRVFFVDNRMSDIEDWYDDDNR